MNWTTAWSNNATRWTPNTATFDLATPATVTVNSNIDAGSITFTTGGWTLAPGTGVLAYGATGTMTITTTTGADTINATIADGSTFSTGGGTTSLTESGPGTLILGAANTYTGSTTITAGILQLATNNALPTTTALTVSGGPTPDTAGTLDLHGKNQSLASIAGGAGATPALITNNLAATTSTLTLIGSAGTSFDGGLRDGAGILALTKSGTGILTLNGQDAYTGPTTISSGRIIISILWIVRSWLDPRL